MEKKYPIGGTVTILINVDSNTIESVYADTAEAIDACRNNRNLSPLTFPVIGRAAPQRIGWVKASDPGIKEGTYIAKYKKVSIGKEYVGRAIVGKEYITFFGENVQGLAWHKRHEELNDIQLLDESQPQPVEDWISINDQLPKIMEYVMVYNTEGATLIGRLMSNGWVAMFADGEILMSELTATHWRPLPEPPKKKP
jgi:Protein of unknown function (DUF551)